MRPLLLALLLLSPLSASAQSDEAYRARVQEAVLEFDAHRFEEARALFRQAHAISPSARTLRGIGLASFEMGDYAEAYRALEASLADPRRPLTDTQRPVVMDVLERARRFVGLYAVEAPTEEATITVDDLPPTRAADGRLVLTLGSHTVAVHAAGHRSATAVVAVGGGEQDTLSITPTPMLGPPSPSAPEPARALAASTPPIREVAREAPDAALPIALLAAGGGLAAAAIVVGLAWWLPRDQEQARCVEAGAACFNLGELTGVRDAAAGTTIAAAVLGAAGLVTGAALLVSLEPGPTPIACAPAGAGITCVGRF